MITFNGFARGSCAKGQHPSEANIRKEHIVVHRVAQAVERSSSGTSDGQRINFNMIKSRLGDLMYKITAQKFEDPADGEDAVRSSADPDRITPTLSHAGRRCSMCLS